MKYLAIKFQIFQQASEAENNSVGICDGFHMYECEQLFHTIFLVCTWTYQHDDT